MSKRKKPCPACNGEGWINTGSGPTTETRMCDRCRGKGE